MSRTTTTLLTVVVLLLVAPALASATILENRDDRDYVLTLEQGSGSVSATVRANKSVSFRCAAFPCKLSLSGVDASITLKSASEDVFIKNGRLVRHKRAARQR